MPMTSLKCPLPEIQGLAPLVMARSISSSLLLITLLLATTPSVLRKEVAFPLDLADKYVPFNQEINCR